MENLLARRELTMLISEGNVLKVVIQEPDAYSGLHCIEFISTIFDTYTGKWLDPRRKQLFMTPDQLAKFGEFLLDK